MNLIRTQPNTMNLNFLCNVYFTLLHSQLQVANEKSFSIVRLYVGLSVAGKIHEIFKKK